MEIFKNNVAEFRAQYTQLRQLKAQPNARRNKDSDAKLSIDLKNEDFVAAIYSEDCQVYIGELFWKQIKTTL